MANEQLNRVVRHLRSLGETQLLAEESDGQLLERFTSRWEEPAFAALCRRHGPMVLSVSQRVLRRVQDAEDVFQATFLLLARKAGSIRKRASVSSWLHGVAYRLAVRAKSQRARRQAHEKRAADMRTKRSSSEITWLEAQAVLDAALGGLPEKYRATLVLCYLEGKSHAEAAQLLGCPLATVRTRVARGRKLLRDLLTSRGLPLSTAGLAALLLASVAPARAPAALVTATLKAALPFAAGQTAAALCSPPVAGLVEGGLKAVFFTKVKAAMALLLAVSVLVGAGALLHRGLLAATGPEPQTASEEAQPPAAAKEGDRSQAAGAKPAPASQVRAGNTVQVRGRVLDPDGKPCAGAKLYLNYFAPQDENWPVRATSGAAGRFSFTFQRSLLNRSSSDSSSFQVIAIAEGFGPDWVHQAKPGASTELVLRLVPDRPIRGRVLDLDGRPVKGATLRIEEIYAYANPEAFLQSVRDREWPLVDSKGWGGPFPGQPRLLTTGADGRIRLTGVGRDRVIQFQLEGPGIQYGPVRALVREMKAPVEPRQLKPPAYGPNITKIYGATFDHAAVPSRPIRGVIRDKKTGRPVAGVELNASGTTHRTRSGKEGRYELLGCPKNAEGYSVTAQPAGQLYFSASVHFRDTPGLGRVQGDIDLISGISVQGRVRHRVTGQPIAGARVHYSTLYPNPFVRWFGQHGAGCIPCSWTETGPDGSYRLVVLPGPGALGFMAHSFQETFMPALITARDLKDFFKDNEFHGNADMLRLQAGVNGWNVVGQEQFTDLLLIRPSEKDETLRRDVALQPARPLRGKVVGPDGKRLAAVTAYHLAPGILSQRLADDTFTVEGVNLRRTRHLLFMDKDGKHGAFVTITGKVKEPLIVRLTPCGSVAGRLLDEDGQLVAGATVRLDPESLPDVGSPKVKTDRAGRFRIDGLVSGLKYQARLGPGTLGQYLFAPFILKPGRSKDLGDVQVKSKE